MTSTSFSVWPFIDLIILAKSTCMRFSSDSLSSVTDSSVAGLGHFSQLGFFPAFVHTDWPQSLSKRVTPILPYECSTWDNKSYMIIILTDGFLHFEALVSPPETKNIKNDLSMSFDIIIIPPRKRSSTTYTKIQNLMLKMKSASK